MLDKTPLEMALEREGQIEYCDECEYVRSWTTQFSAACPGSCCTP